jgi:hypothetical protein
MGFCPALYYTYVQLKIKSAPRIFFAQQGGGQGNCWRRRGRKVAEHGRQDARELGYNAIPEDCR